MSSRRSVRQLLVAVLLGVLVGGGLMAVTPAGAEVAQAAATSWKKIWKKELKPLADKRYYQKSQSDTKYASKAEAAAAAAAAQSAATNSANAATDSKLGGYYKKTESDAKYLPLPKTIRGVFTARDFASVAGQFTDANVSWGYTLAAAPTPLYVLTGGTNPNCPGTVANPQANPGFACFYEQGFTGVTADRDFFNPFLAGASPYGVDLRITSSGATQYGVWGRWAVTPAAPVVTSRTAPSFSGQGQAGGNSAGN